MRVAKNKFTLVKKADFVQLQAQTEGTGAQWLKSAVVEVINFEEPGDSLVAEQQWTTDFVSDTVAYVNVLACYVWVKFSHGGAGRRKTGFPYGCREEHKELKRFEEKGMVDGSSRRDDGWRV